MYDVLFERADGNWIRPLATHAIARSELLTNRREREGERKKETKRGSSVQTISSSVSEESVRVR